ncbi:hypothetical protein [Sphingomonas sp. ERG5]|uniref:hypothetical protein n=1 Tax=Sphingomonas sp. ERG5 TaxID=1381597 RepID=UPI000ACCA7AD|nr:hypothetical protein [Sphingomonas sp. ERG5]
MKFTKRYPGYDAVLDTDRCSSRNNADLTLTLRIGFRQINPMAGAETGSYPDFGDPSRTLRQTVKWTPKDWAAWKLNFCNSAQRFWDKKFWLDNRGGDFAFRQGMEIFIPNIFCRLELIGNDDTVGTHHVVIDVVRLAATESFFGSNARLFDSKDTNLVQKGTDSKGKAIMQRAHVHEVGHLLGLGHVAIGKPGCPASGDPDLTPCYGVTDEDKNSVMGGGMRLDVVHAAPWITAFNDLAAAQSTSSLFRLSPSLPVYSPPILKTRPTAAVMSQIYPRNIAEFEAGTELKTLKRGR